MTITEVLSVIELYRMNEIKILCKYVKKNRKSGEK